jgi:rod shape-determining protein MreB
MNLFIFFNLQKYFTLVNHSPSWTFCDRFSISMSIFSPKLGIDLGTANTLVYIPGKGIVLDEPSVVAMSEYNKEILAIGLEAREMLGKTVDGVMAYKPMRDGVIADYRMTTAMLAHFIKKAMGFWSFIKPEVMISVPAGVTSTERRAVVEAAIKAGAKKAQQKKLMLLP